MASTTALRAGLRPRNLALAVVTVLGCLMACGQPPGAAEPKVTGSAFWPISVASTPAVITPFGDGAHAWILEQGAVSVVDLRGQRLFERNAWLPAGVRATALIQTNHPGRAWVIGHTSEQGGGQVQSSVYLIDAAREPFSARVVLEAEQLQRLSEQSSENFFSVNPHALSLQDSKPHAHLWVVFRAAGQDFLAVIDAEGKLSPRHPLPSLGNHGRSEPEGWQVVPVGGGRPRAWLKAHEHLFFIDAQVVFPQRRPLLRAEQILRVLPGPQGTTAWVVADVGSQTSSGLVRQLYLIDAGASSSASPAPLLGGEEVRQAVPSPDGTRVWVASEMGPGARGQGGVHLVDLRGRSLLPSGPLLRGEEVLVVVTRSGRVWLLTRTGGAWWVDENGEILASDPKAVPPTLIGEHPAGFKSIFTLTPGPEDVLVWQRGVVHLRAAHGRVQTSPLIGGAEVFSIDVDPGSQGVWLLSAQDGSLYFVSLQEDRYLEKSFVMKVMGETTVFPAGDGQHGWIQSVPSSFSYIPLTEVGATLMLRGGSLEVENGSHVTVQGSLTLRAPLQRTEEASVDLKWPGRAGAAQAAGILDVSLWDDSHADGPVASLTWQPGRTTPPPELQWHLDELFIQARDYRVVYRYHDQTGIDTTLVIHPVRFSAPLGEQVWFRTALACVIATLLFGLPLLLLPRARFARDWLPFIGWSLQVLAGSGLAFTNLTRSLRIHFPLFVLVLFVELFLCLLAGALMPSAFRLLAPLKPFQWLTPLALALPRMRRRLFASYVAHVWRKLEAQRIQANDERYVPLPAEVSEGGVRVVPPHPQAPPAPPELLSHPETRIREVLTAPHGQVRGNVLIESPGGRGKSALLRESVRQMLLHFEQVPSGPLPVLCDASAPTLEEAALRALEADPLLEELREVMLVRGDCILIVDGLTESSFTPEALRGFLEGRYGRTVRVLCTSRPHVGFRQVLESSERWLHVQPRRLDEPMLDRFVSAYTSGKQSGLRADLRSACRGPDGTYLPILVRLALLVGQSPAGNIAELYEATFRGLLRRHGSGAPEEDTEMLAWASAYCLRTYWANGIRSLRYRNAPERDRLEKLLRAGVLVPDDPRLDPGQMPSQVRFFHDSMQSYLTACGLFAQEYEHPTWQALERAAADPVFASAQSELVSGVGSELFQMCLHVFGPEERLRGELRRQLLEWARLHDDDLKKRDILDAVPAEAQDPFRLALERSPALAPRDVLSTATGICAQAGLALLGTFYMRIANLVWPLEHPAAS